MSAASSPSLAECLRCSRSGETASLDRASFLSPVGAPWLVDYRLGGVDGDELAARWRARPWSMWRYLELLPPVAEARRIDLGEGGTPLVRLSKSAPEGVEVWFKEEAGNPTGSFKDRGLSMAVNRAVELGAPGVQLPSAGNAALALTAYAAAAGLPARVAVPEDTPATVLERCRGYGAEVLTAPGTLLDAARRLEEFDDGFWTLATMKEPYRAEGKKTMGLELADQCDWNLPDWIVYPTGGGTGIIGMQRAFDQLEELGLLTGSRPRFLAVQMEGCAPIVEAFEHGRPVSEPWKDAATEVWGLRVPKAIGDFLILDALVSSGGAAVRVEEARIEPTLASVARRDGLRFGPEGAACLLAIEQGVERGLIRRGQRVALFQTGHPDNYR